MTYDIKRCEYYYVTVKDEPGEAYKLLSSLANRGINLYAFIAVPIGPVKTQLSIFPDDPSKFAAEAQRDAMPIDGPHHALLVEGDDELGALSRVHMRLADAMVNVYASYGVSNGRGSFGYVIYVRPEDFEKAAESLGL